MVYNVIKFLCSIASQEKYEEELRNLRGIIADLETQCVRLSGQRGTPVGQNEYVYQMLCCY